MPLFTPNQVEVALRPAPAPCDDELAQRARRGDQAATEELLDRHLASTWQLASVVHGSPAPAKDATVRSVATTMSRPPSPTVHLLPVRYELLAAARAASVEPPAPPTNEWLLVDAVGRTRTAFEALPEGWRTVLWLRLVEGIGARHAAPILSLSVAGTEQLLDRARAGWHDAAVRQLVANASEVDCRRTASRLSGYVDDRLTERDRSRVRRHLDGCDRCRAALEELDDLAPLLRRSAPGVPIDLRHLALAAWLERTRGNRGPFGMVLPGGRPVPAWAERTLAGAAAAVVALGITAAALSSGRGGTSSDDLVVLEPVGPFGPPDGESALADLPVGPGSGAADGAGGGPAGTEAPAAPGSAGTASDAGDDSARALPRTTAGGAPPPSAVPPPAPAAPPDPGNPPAPSEAPPAVTVRIDGDTGASIGEDCTGAEVLGVVIGCEPPADSSLPLPGI